MSSKRDIIESAALGFQVLTQAMKDYRFLAGEMLAFFVVNMQEGRPFYDRMEPTHRAKILTRLQKWQEFKDRVDQQEGSSDE